MVTSAVGCGGGQGVCLAVTSSVARGAISGLMHDFPMPVIIFLVIADQWKERES
jgi:hypothetical protein